MNHAVIPYQTVRDPIEFVEKLGDAIARSGMFGCKNVESGKVLAMTCLSERKSPTEIARRYHIIDGRLSMKAGAMLADFRTKGGRHRIVERSPERAAIELTIDGQTQQFEFTWEQAQQEPFVRDKKNNLKTNYATPRIRMQMLWARVVSDSIEAMAPEIAYGVYTPEEISDFQEINGAGVQIADDHGEAEFEVVPTPPEVAQVLDESEKSKFPENANGAPNTAPCTQQQIGEIKRLATHVCQLDPGFKERFKSGCEKKPLNSYTIEGADKLILWLQKKSAELSVDQSLGGAPEHS